MFSIRTRKAQLLIMMATLVLSLLLIAGCVSDASSNDKASESAAAPEPQDTQAVEKDAEPGIHYVLAIGNDAWEDYYPTDRSDLMMLMRIDCAKGEIALISIPRDTRYEWEDGHVTKANEVYAQEGPEGALKAVRQITGLDVTDYVDIGFDGLQDTVNYLNGLEMDLPYTINYHFYTNDHSDEVMEAGDQVIDGWHAMVLSRARTGYEPYGLNQDMMRQVMNRQMMTNLMRAVLSDRENSIDLAQALLPNVDTNISDKEIIAWIKQLQDFDSLTVYGNSGPVNGDIDSESELWLCYPNPEAWQALISALDAGEDPTVVNANEGCVESDIAPIRSTTTIEID